MSAANVRIVERAVGAVNERDIETYLGFCTDDVELRTPVTPIEGSYRGAVGIRRFFSDVAAVGPDFRIEIERTQTTGSDRVLAFTQITASGRESGIDVGSETAHLYDLVDGKIHRVEVFLDRQEALRQAGLTG